MHDRVRFERALVLSTATVILVGALLVATSGDQAGEFPKATLPVKAMQTAKPQVSSGAAESPMDILPLAPNQAPASSPFTSTPTWSQDFAAQPDGPPSTKYWNFDLGNNNGWGNNEVETYTDNAANIRIADGALVIQALRDRTSARINTAGKFDFTYGKLDIVAKLPTGQGIWPALWLWPSGNKYTSDNADSGWLANGEIDMIEGQALGDNQISGSAHSVNHFPPLSNGERTGYANVPNITADYHTYSLEWTPDQLTYLVDGQAFYHVDNPHTSFKDWPYDQPYHLILNVALGGSMNPAGLKTNDLPATMSVKSIDYYSFK